MAETSRRPVRNSSDEAPARRRTSAQQPVVPLKYSIIAIVVIVLGVGGALGYGPFVRSQLTGKIDSGDKQAAADLVARKDGYAAPILIERARGNNPQGREAAVHGLVIMIKDGDAQTPALLEAATGAVKSADAAGKVALTKSLAELSKSSNKQVPAELAKALIPLTSESEGAEVRVAAVDALSSIAEPGVCAALLKVASQPGDLRKKALPALKETARPDAAGELLRAMAGSDKELAEAARPAFARVRDGAKSEELLPLVNDPNDAVRREIVDALGKRKADPKAAEGISAALKDKLPEIRILALKAVPTTGVAGSTQQLSALVSDSEEKVREQNAETLAQLADPDSYQVILGAFEKGITGSTQTAYIKALGKRTGSGKDLKAIGTLMGLLAKTPAAEPSIREALVLLTNPNRDSKRTIERSSWNVEKWKSWFANISKREEQKEKALAMLQAADKRKQESKKLYPELLKQTSEALDILEKCREMCSPDDPEDVNTFEGLQAKYMKNKDLFFKHQELDMKK